MPAKKRRLVPQPLTGSGARTRTRARRKPMTRADLLRARAAYCQGRPACWVDLEAASWEKRTGSGQIAHYRERIIEGEIAPGKPGCTVYLTRAEDTGQGIPDRAAPYNVNTLCQGGRRVWGGAGYASISAARAAGAVVAALPRKPRKPR